MISYPRPMLTLRGMRQSFEPERVDLQSPEAGGYLGGIQAGFPRWLMTLTYNSMSLNDAAILRAWMAGQRGAQRQFFAFDIDRQKPKFYLRGGAFAATPASWSQTIGSNEDATLRLTGLMAGQIVSIGDYVGVSWGSRMALTRSQETVAAGAGGVADFVVEPPLPPIVPTDAAITLNRAGCLMKLITGQTKLAEQDLGFFAAGTTIVAAQDFGR